MAKKENLKCKGCGELFPRENLISYSARGGAMFNYCKKCYAEKISRDKFANYICELFGLRAPGTMIYAQRKRLIEQGFSDETILMTLHYLYYVRGADRSKATLGLINYENVYKAKDYFSSKEKYQQNFEEKVNNKETRVIYAPVSVPEPEKKKQIDLNSLEEEW